MPDGTHPTYADTTGSEKMLYSNIQRLMIQGDNFNDEDELSLISDMRQFNIIGKNETSKFDMYWKAVIRAMETESTHGVHERTYMLLVILMPPTGYHMLLVYPPTISSKAPYSFFTRMD